MSGFANIYRTLYYGSACWNLLAEWVGSWEWTHQRGLLGVGLVDGGVG